MVVSHQSTTISVSGSQCLSQLFFFVVSLPVNWLGPSDLDAAVIQDKFVFGGLIGFLSSLPSGEMNKSVVFKSSVNFKREFSCLQIYQKSNEI